VICLRLLWQDAYLAFSRALANTGNRIAARIAMIAITTSSSISCAILTHIALVRRRSCAGLSYGRSECSLPEATHGQCQETALASSARGDGA